MRLTATRASVTSGSGGEAVNLFGTAALDLRFAATKSFVDQVSSNNLITFLVQALAPMLTVTG